jgi:hypothetical protein
MEILFFHHQNVTELYIVATRFFFFLRSGERCRTKDINSRSKKMNNDQQQKIYPDLFPLEHRIVRERRGQGDVNSRMPTANREIPTFLYLLSV